MIHTRRGLVLLMAAAGLILSASGALAQTLADIPKQDFYGTWKMSHDGWAGTLILKASGQAKVLDGQYKGLDGKVHLVTGEASGHKIDFRINFDDSNRIDDGDQKFSGYLFTQGRGGMAGTTALSGATYGWYAVKESTATSFPAVSSDYPDPSGPVGQTATITSAQHSFSVKAGKAEYARGEAVDFHMANELDRTVNLAGIVYVIKRLDNGAWKEFFTSARDFLPDLTMNDGKKRDWTWSQWDNEHQVKAAPGKWRMRLLVPDVRPEPFFVEFTIKN